jgi:cellulose synthase/poly-beta-1,6-N-acetylglucosamine synthase-like glycosyltransferase
MGESLAAEPDIHTRARTRGGELTMVAAAFFWAFAAILGYVYLGYPIIVRLLASVMGRPVARAAGLRLAVTVIITAYNEQRSIRAKIDNVLGLEYPPQLLDVLVVSDASTDATDQIARSYGSERVRLLRVEGRLGKTACQNKAVTQARGEIVVFTDATTLIDRGALLAMVENFADRRVGCVAGRLVYVGRGGGLTAAGGVSYWGYEVALRSAESRLGTLIGVSGCLYGVRREAYRPIAPELISDFVVAMRMREQGLRTVLEPRAVCFEETLEDSHQELSMRVRVALRSINALVGERRFLNPLVDPLFAWQLWSHKLLRYASPYCLAGLLGSCAMLAADPLYGLVLIVLAVFLAAGIAGFVLQLSARRIGLLARPYYFLLTNLASVIATLRYLRGERMITWNPAR